MRHFALLFLPTMMLLLNLSVNADNTALAEPAILAEAALPAFYLQLKAEQNFPAAWQSSQEQDIAAWRLTAHQLLRQALLWPEQQIAFAPELIASEQREGYQAERWLITLTPGNRVPILLLRPEGEGPFPAVLLLHDHGAHFAIGKEKLIRPFAGDDKLADAVIWTERHYGGNFLGDELAQQGYLVLAADTLGWGERGPLMYDAQQALAANFLQLGRSLAGFVAYEDMRLAAFLKQLAASKAQQIAAIGFSMGAYRAWQLSALTDDIQAAVAISWMTTSETAITPGNNQLRGQSAFWMLHPGLAAQLDYPHIAAIAAPKPALFIMGGKDKLMPAAGTLQAYQHMQQVWQAHGAEQQLTTELWPEMGHEFAEAQQQRVWQWLSTVFSPR